MKKFISLLLSVVMLFSIGIMSATAANAEKENLCEEFQELENFCLWYNGISPFNLYALVGWTSDHIPNLDDYEYSEKNEEEDYLFFGFKVPADVLEEYANKYFAFDGDLRTLVREDIILLSLMMKTQMNIFMDMAVMEGSLTFMD